MENLASKMGRREEWLSKELSGVFFCFSVFFLLLLLFFRAAPVAHGGSQARGPIGAVAAGLRHSQSNAGSDSTALFLFFLGKGLLIEKSS